MKVMVIEKDAPMAGVMRALLENWGHETQVCTRGKDAIRMFRIGDYDLVLMDVLLPDISGNELISRIKELSPDARIVAMTGKNSRELEARIREQGILYYMVKPLETENLRSLLEYVSSKGKKPSQWATSR